MKRKSYKTKIALFLTDVWFLMILSLSVFIMPYAEKTNDADLFRVVNGIMFWVGFAGTFAFAFLINYFRRKDKLFNRAAEKYNRLALTHFFQNLPATVFDVLLIASLTGFIGTIAFKASPTVSFVFLSVIVFSFGMHCMLNGINFIYVMNKRIRRVKKHE